MAAGATDNYVRRHLVLLLERPQLAAVVIHEPLGRPPQRVRESLRHDGTREIRRLPELELGGCDVDPQIRTQPVLYSVDEQPADVVHVHVGQHHVGHGCEIDAGGLQSPDQPPGLRQVQARVHPYPSIDEYGPAAATNHGYVQWPLEHFRRQELVLQPGRPDGRFDVVRNSPGWNWQHTVADNQHVNRADLLRVARRNHLVGFNCGGPE